MTTQILENLARSRSAHTEAATSLDHATQANSALLVRLTEARARGEEAVRETKAKGDPDGKWSMQLRLSMDDQSDIQALLNQSQATIQSRTAALSAATQAVHSAELQARREEAEIHAKDLDDVILELQSKFCEALQARLAAHNMLNPRSASKTSCFNFYQSSPLMKNIVANGQVA